MTGRRRLLFAVLVYVTLDLSVASMPGAFVFDAADSVESVRMSRVRTLPVLTTGFPETRDRAIVVPSTMSYRSGPAQPLRPTPPNHHGRRTPASDVVPPSEDPH